MRKCQKGQFWPNFPVLVAVQCATDFNNMHYSGLRRQRAFHKKCFSKMKKNQLTLSHWKKHKTPKLHSKQVAKGYNLFPL